MNMWLDIKTPETFMHFVEGWPEGAPIPAAGDQVQWHTDGAEWLFKVTGRSLQVGNFPGSQGTGILEHGIRVLLTVDSTPPAQWDPRRP